jgi:hypothetical protein
MAIRALELMTKVSSRFACEIVPVATASVIGAMLVNHYGHQPASPPIVIQAQPSASEDAMVQSLREEHELIAGWMKRNQEGDMNGERSGSGSTQLASVAAPLSVVDPPLPEPRPAAQKAAARLAPKPAARKKSAPAETPSLPPNAPAIAAETPLVPDPLPPPVQIELDSRVRPIVRVAGAMSEWVAGMAQTPARVAFVPRLPDWPSMPPLARTLGFFRQN